MLFEAMTPWYMEQNPHPLPFCPWSLPAASSWVKQQHHCRAQPPWESQRSHGEPCARRDPDAGESEPHLALNRRKQSPQRGTQKKAELERVFRTHGSPQEPIPTPRCCSLQSSS